MGLDTVKYYKVEEITKPVDPDQLKIFEDRMNFHVQANVKARTEIMNRIDSMIVRMRDLENGLTLLKKHITVNIALRRKTGNVQMVSKMATSKKKSTKNRR